MKSCILLLAISCLTAISADAQSLKELLYSGKLKNDSIVRKTDDLKSKIDTTSRKQPAGQPVMAADSLTLQDSTDLASGDLADSAATAAATEPAEAVPYRSNNKIWRDYSDSLIASLKTTVLPNKKVKKDIYYFMVDYEIDLDGKVTVTNVSVTPENVYLLGYMQQHMFGNPPQLNPSDRKVRRRHSFSVIKD